MPGGTAKRQGGLILPCKWSARTVSTIRLILGFSGVLKTLHSFHNNFYIFKRKLTSKEMLPVETLWNILNSNVGVVILTDIGTAVLTIILCALVNKYRTQRKQKEEFDKILGGKIANALDSVRDLELLMKTKEAYDIENRLDSNEKLDFFAYSGDVYPSIMASNESFFQFIDKVGEAINNYEKYLNYNVAAYLSYTQNYCMDAVAYAIKHKIPLNALGTKIFPDFLELQKKFDIELVNQTNSPQYKVYSLNGPQWEDAKEKVIEPLLQNSVLYKMINENVGVEIEIQR